MCVCECGRKRERKRDTPKIERERVGAQRKLNENKKVAAAVSYNGCFTNKQTEEQIEKVVTESGS